MQHLEIHRAVRVYALVGNELNACLRHAFFTFSKTINPHYEKLPTDTGRYTMFGIV